METNHAVAYLRVSTKAQNNSTQRFMIQNWLKDQEDMVLDETFEDICSGTRILRPGLDAMLTYIDDCVAGRNGKSIDIILIVTPDRLTRDLDHAFLLLQMFKSRNVRVIPICHQTINTLTPEGRLMFGSLIEESEKYRVANMEKSKENLKKHIEAGGKVGRPAKKTEYKGAQTYDR